jgi:type I restriction enzyme M protein
MSATNAAPASGISLADAQLDIDARGRLIDYLNPTQSRVDGPEERIRQNYARILHEEYSYSKDCMAFEVPVNIGSDVRFADIAVYQSPDACLNRDQGRISLVVETKAPNKLEGHGQLVSYIFASSAAGGVWTNGTDPVGYFRRVDAPALALIEWTNIPRVDETWETVGHYRKQDLRPPRDLKQVFRRCHNAIYRIGVDSEDLAMDMVRIVLAKYRDEQNEGDVCQFRCSPDEFKTSDGKFNVGARIRALFKEVVDDYPDVFGLDEQITISDDPLSVVVSELQPFRFLSDDDTEQVYDTIGTAFEVYVATHLKGARGQYFTNRLVVNMMVAMLDPSEREFILDLACGSGGFLIACLRYVRQKILHSDRSRAAKHKELRAAPDKLYGIDISPKLIKVAKTNMILNGDGHGGMVRGNTLQDLSVLPLTFPLRHVHYKRGKQAPTIIMTNPPFGASHELRVQSRDILDQFQLGHAWTPDETGWLSETQLTRPDGVPIETLFLERCVEMLAPGGRLAIVIARGLLDNRDSLSARQYLLENTKLRAVINCHPNTFAPFNGTKAAILIVEKKPQRGFQRDEDYPVFMAISQRVGQDSQGREIHKKDSSGELVLDRGQRIVDHDLGQILDAWRQFQTGAAIDYEAAWTVPLSRIISETDMRFNPLRYAPDAEQAVARVMELADSQDWYVERLGDFATVFNGPRFKRPFAGDGIMSGDQIVRMYTPKAFFEERGESAKYLDLAHATKTQIRAVEILRLERDMILIADSGTAGKLLGRVGITTAAHVDSIGNNNLTRVVIEDAARRDYVYRFLRSELGQTLILRNVYGTNQDHVEPDDVKDIPIPIPRDGKWLGMISRRARQEVLLRERVSELNDMAQREFEELIGNAFAAQGIEAPISMSREVGEPITAYPDDDLQSMRDGFTQLLGSADLAERLGRAIEEETDAETMT